MSSPDNAAYADNHYASDLSFERGLRSRGYREVKGLNDRGTPIGKLPSDGVLRFFRDAYGNDLVAVALSLSRRLRGDVWRTQAGEELTAAEMTVSHAQNLKRWLERRARVIILGAQIEMMCMVSDHDGGEHAHDALEQEEAALNEMGALEHLHELPLYRAIVERAGEAFVRG